MSTPKQAKERIRQRGKGPQPADPLGQAVKVDEAALLPLLQIGGVVGAQRSLVEQPQLRAQRHGQQGKLS